MPKEKRFKFAEGPDFPSQEERKVKLGILSDNVMSYYRNVSSTLETGFDKDNPSDKDNFLTNVYNTLKDEAIQVSQNQTVSRILELLFSHSKSHHMRDIFCNFCSNLTIVVFDRFASHVFQSLIQHLPSIYEEIKSSKGSKNSPVYASIEQLCKFTESYLRDIMTHTYASHVLRSLLEALGGVKVKEEVVRSRLSRVQNKANERSNQPIMICKSLSQDFQQSFKVLSEKIVKLCNFEDHLSDPSYCPVLQTVLLILHKTSVEEYNSLVETILNKACTVPDKNDKDGDNVSERLPDIVQSEVGSYMVELIISLASETQLGQIHDQIFKRNLIAFAVHPIANYVLQKLLLAASDPTMVKDLLTDISQYLEDILAVGHVGIVTRLAEACRNTHTGHEKFMKALLTTFHCHDPPERQIKIVPLIASLQTYEVFFGVEDLDNKTKQEGSCSKNLLKSVNIHGSLLLQQLLQFTNPKLIVASLLDLSPAELVGLCCDKFGSHVVDTFFQTTAASDSQKLMFLKKLEGLYANVACNRNGSRCLESVWKVSPLKWKILIAEELSKNHARIEGDQWGHFLYHNFALFKFSQRRKEWMDIQGANTKRQQLLNDILQGTAKKKKNKKQMKDKSQSNQVVSTITSLEDNKMHKKRPHTESTTSTTEQSLEEKQLKKKSKLKDAIKTTSNQESTVHTNNDRSSQKKRKRNKEKKRIVRIDK